MEKTTQTRKDCIKNALAGFAVWVLIIAFFVAWIMIVLSLFPNTAKAHGTHDWEPKNRSEEPKKIRAPFFTRVSPSDEISPRGRYIVVNGRQFYCDGVVEGEGC